MGLALLRHQIKLVIEIFYSYFPFTPFGLYALVLCFINSVHSGSSFRFTLFSKAMCFPSLAFIPKSNRANQEKYRHALIDTSRQKIHEYLWKNKNTGDKKDGDE